MTEQMTPLEYVIWEALEPRVEDVINLDLNDPEESQAFRELARQVAAAVSGFVGAQVDEGRARAWDQGHSAAGILLTSNPPQLPSTPYRARTAGVVSEEPEWEYRAVACEPDTGDIYDSMGVFESPAQAIDNAERYELLASNADLPQLVLGVHGRVKAGPWVPVKQEGADQ